MCWMTSARQSGRARYGWIRWRAGTPFDATAARVDPLHDLAVLISEARLAGDGGGPGGDGSDAAAGAGHGDRACRAG